jgi:transcriptional regulator with XRE-family HTH domain
MELDYEMIGKRIKAARNKKGYTQEKLANITGLSQPHIGHVEVGKSKIALPALIKVANALDTTVDALLYDSTLVHVDAYDKEFKDIVDDCTSAQKEHLLEVVKLAKKGFDV